MWLFLSMGWRMTLKDYYEVHTERSAVRWHSYCPKTHDSAFKDVIYLRHLNTQNVAYRFFLHQFRSSTASHLRHNELLSGGATLQTGSGAWAVECKGLRWTQSRQNFWQLNTPLFPFSWNSLARSSACCIFNGPLWIYVWCIYLHG